jgi:acetyl-CoA carboxylase carboxyl transferase subunit alpha
MLAAGIIETIIPEPMGGAHRDPQFTARKVEDYLGETIRELKQIPAEDLIEQRYQRYRRLGVFARGAPLPAPADQGADQEEPASDSVETQEP